MICIADIRIHKRIIKSIKKFSPEAVGAQGGVLGDGVVQLHNLQESGGETFKW